MDEARASEARKAVDAAYRAESRRVFATLVRLLGDFDVAEEALHDAFRAALEQWPVEGVPANPRAWLVSTGRFKAIDGIRRRARFEAVEDFDAFAGDIAAEEGERHEIEDDRLRLIFTCCHPALATDAQVALTLREVCGLRAERLDGVLRTIYLVFNEGYSASSGETLTRSDLSLEAIRLGRLLVELLPEPEAVGLLALMLLQESRRPARANAAGELILLDDQDRSLWDRAQIAEGTRLVERALASRRFGPYAIQAAIAAVHAEAPAAAATDWDEIVG